MTREEAIKSEADLRRRLAVNVRRRRKAKRLTIQQAGARAEIHWRMWQKSEARESNATLFTLTRLANALDVDPKELLLRVATRDADGVAARRCVGAAPPEGYEILIPAPIVYPRALAQVGFTGSLRRTVPTAIPLPVPRRRGRRPGGLCQQRGAPPHRSLRDSSSK